jgi:protein O-mannosyl-transferase
LAERANEFTRRKDPVIGATLAAAYAETGRFSEAILTAEDALRLTNDGGNTAVARLLRGQIALYQAHQPFRDNR